jgi:hypothetical protein
MKKMLITAALALPMLASAQNLLTNGSFENGLAGWTVNNGVGFTFPVTAITYGVLPGAFNEIVPPDNNPNSRSPDAAGDQAVYFVDDAASQSISQEFTVSQAGGYFVGFSFYVPTNGSLNPGDVRVSISGSGVVADIATISQLPVASWGGFPSTINLMPGTYTYTLSFEPLGTGFGKDILFDRTYVVAVPEPGTYALFAAGLGIMGLIAARRRRD